MSYDIERGISHFVNSIKEYYLDRDGIVKPEPTREQMIEKYPWVFYGEARGMPCFLRHSLYFTCFGVIPEHCVKNCWKTVVKPYKLSDLFRISEYLDKNDLASKCGLDMRPFSFGTYLGVIYAETHSEGKEREAEAKEAFPELDVFLKKGCTEFENRLNSKFWNVTDNQIELEKKLRDRVDHTWPKFFKQPDWLIEKIQTYWTQTAYAIADPTWEESPYADKIITSRPPSRY